MRIMIKGGLWKNTEDEILKAGVMKYGKNQWARISSLLVRKSATQCKARWYEWLDPSIKKIEWTREEDEKLMHLAKLMPSQWRTIAPIVGRTPSQCLERYEKLLDAVCAKDENYEPGDDPRKLRPGEIDPNPESKPARPDPVDMDADEKNLLSEAQARLANTRGKKAKRKAREKQLEEARRLASLQKRRELKAAGMDVQYRGRKMKGIDYNAEIPFEKRPPPGFYDVIDEDRPVEQPKFPTTIEELEGERRLDKEARLRKQDITRNKIAQREDPSEIMQACKLNDPETVKRRSKLKLPVPQIPDHELEAIAKNGIPSDVIGSEELADGNAATHALLASYAQTTKYARWNVGPVDENEKKMLSEARIRLANTRVKKAKRKAREKQLEEARRLASLLKRRELKAPGIDVRDRKRKGIDYKAEISFAKRRPLGFYDVVDEDRPVEQPKIPTTEELEGERSVDKESRMREHDIAQNKIAQRQDSPSAIMQVNKLNDLETVRRRRSKLNLPSPKGAHMRDKLHINEDMDILGRANLGQHNARNEFLVDLRNLPQPKNEFQIVMPPPPEDKEKSEAKIVEDMSDSIAKMKIEQEDRQQALLRKRSKVLQRELPRPPAGSLDLIRKSLLRADEDKSTVVPLTLIEQADEMVRKELLALLEHDIINYPLDEKAEKGEKHIKKSLYVPMQDDFTEEELKEADNLIAEEAQFLRLAMGHEDVACDEFVDAVDAQTSVNDIMTEFEKVKQMVADVTKKAEMKEAKTKTLLQGYQNRAEKLWNQIQETSSKMNTAETGLECFQALKIQEQLASSNRINCIREEVQKQKELERTLQTRYGDLLAERERIHKVKESYRVQEEEIVDSSDDGKQDPRRH